jgi:hypothetical protein
MQAGSEEGDGDIKILRPCPALLEMELMMLTTRSRRVQELLRDRQRLINEGRDAVKRQVAPHNPASQVLHDGDWAGKPAFLIGGGPSLLGFDFERLRGKGHVIAINRAFEFIPFADILFFMDWKFYKRCHDIPDIREKWTSFTGHKVFLNLMGRKLDDVYSMRSLGRNGVSGSLAKGLYHGNNSGVGALNLALCLRAQPIYLLGYDMRHEGGRSHFHGGYGPRASEHTAKSFIREFERMAKALGERRKTIINLNPRSGLRIFPFGNVDEVLRDKTGQGVGDDARAVPAPELQPASA